MARTSLKEIEMLIERDEHNLKFTLSKLQGGNLRPLQKTSFIRQVTTIKNRLEHHKKKYQDLYGGDTIVIVTYKSSELLTEPNLKYCKIYYVGITDSIELQRVIERDEQKYGIFYHGTQAVTSGVIEKFQEIPKLEK